jgi:hypothetical protein
MRRARDQVNTRSYLTNATRLRLSRERTHRAWNAFGKLAMNLNSPIATIRGKCYTFLMQSEKNASHSIKNVFFTTMCSFDWKKRGEW